jgi:hypothetical protein
MLRLGKDDINSSDDWEIIDRMKDSLHEYGANDLSLRATLKKMIKSGETDLDQIESAYLKSNIVARSLKACLEDATESDESRDIIGDNESLAKHFFIMNLNFFRC